ncbi:hypothetical protein B7463_g1453, partial [Scytalidium lignicola]
MSNTFVRGANPSPAKPEQYRHIRFATAYDDGVHPAKRRRANAAKKSLRRPALEHHETVPMKRLYMPQRDQDAHAIGRQYKPLGDQLLSDVQDITSKPIYENSFLETSPDAESVGATSASPYYTTTRDNQHRVPYFRYFGPTAIAPGYKQMVVQVKQHAQSIDASTTFPSSEIGGVLETPDGNSIQAMSEGQPIFDVPVYDVNTSAFVDPLIMRLVEIFFDNLGCNFPFLQRQRFLKNIENKVAEPILVNAICAVSERFCTGPLVGSSSNGSSSKKAVNAEVGQTFAHRAMIGLVESFPCPTISSVQACLILAYDEFGRNHDSGLWMQLGCSIRMTQDLGLQKVEEGGHRDSNILVDKALSNQPEQQSVELERMYTFWAVLMTDRYVSSGTGRPVTLQDKDVQIPFPPLLLRDDENQWPKPFPALVRIVHVYGKVTDLLNNISDELAAEIFENLAIVETELTTFYQSLPSRLHFSAINFQQYVRSGEGTNFILLHFWFHALIILVHQPKLLHGFTNIQKLFPNSHELSMSSAKTIADIIAFAELIDPKSFTGTPFTSQPIYIAACSFLLEMERLKSSQPTSADHNIPDPTNPTLLASAAIRNYQRCYKALQSQEAYWAGIKYILTALEQKAEGIWDPLLYTNEEMDSTRPPPSLALAWRRQARSILNATTDRSEPPQPENVRGLSANADDALMDPSQAIGWSLGGNVNSPTFSLSLFYQNTSSGTSVFNDTDQLNSTSGSLDTEYRPFPSFPVRTNQQTALHPTVESIPQTDSFEIPNSGNPIPFKLQTTTSQQRPSDDDSDNRTILSLPYQQLQTTYSNHPNGMTTTLQANADAGGIYPTDLDVMISSQEIDMACLGSRDLDFFPQDVLGFFDHSI